MTEQLALPKFHDQEGLELGFEPGPPDSRIHAPMWSRVWGYAQVVLGECQPWLYLWL